MASRNVTARRADEKAVWLYYRRKFRWLNVCVYCGNPADSDDHVFPISRASGLELWRPSVRKALFQGLNVVPSCGDCNNLAGKRPFISIREKRRAIQNRLRRKHKQLLKSVQWDEEDLEELGYSLKSMIRTSMMLKWGVLQRITWPKSPDQVYRAVFEDL